MSKQAIELMHEDLKEVKSDVKELLPQVKQNTDDLKDHIEGVVQNRARIKHIEEKLTIKYLLKLIVAASAGVATIAGALWAVVKLYMFFKGLS